MISFFKHFMQRILPYVQYRVTMINILIYNLISEKHVYVSKHVMTFKLHIHTYILKTYHIYCIINLVILKLVCNHKVILQLKLNRLTCLNFLTVYIPVYNHFVAVVRSDPKTVSAYIITQAAWCEYS